MIFKKHIKLLRKFLGNIARPRLGLAKQFPKWAKFVYLLVEWPFELLGDWLSFWRRAKRKEIKDPRRILIIKIDQLGDVLFSTMLLPVIKKKYPNAEIDYLIHPKSAGVLLKNPHIAQVHFWEDIFFQFLPQRGSNMAIRFMKASRGNRATMRTLRARQYDVVINARAYPPSSNFAWREIGGALIAFDISEQSFLADYWADYSLDAEEWKNYANLLAPLGIDPASVEFSEEFYNHDASNPMARTGTGTGTDAGMGAYVVISPVSFDADRQWKTEQWKKLVSSITTRGMGVAFTGVPSQRKYLESIAATTQSSAVAVHIFTDLHLPEFGALMKGAEFFIGIDSFPAHLALASKKAAFVLTNTALYYLKGHSPKKFMTDGRNMLPGVSQITFFDVRSATADDVMATLPLGAR